MPVKKGDKVKVEYTGTLENGEVFDSSEKHGKPLEFEAGAGQMIKGFDEAVMGMEAGDEKEFSLTPEQAYGEPRQELIQKVPKDKMPKEGEPQAGMMMIVNLPNGQQIPAKITDVTDSDITLDLNHPLAGKKLNFKIKVIEVN